MFGNGFNSKMDFNALKDEMKMNKFILSHSHRKDNDFNAF